MMKERNQDDQVGGTPEAKRPVQASEGVGLISVIYVGLLVTFTAIGILAELAKRTGRGR